MGLTGTFDIISMPELTSLLWKKKVTGTLVVQRFQVQKTFSIENGKVGNAASTDPREYLGQFLVNYRLITEEQLQKAFDTQQETKVMLGKILVMTGIVSQEQLDRMLVLKIRETFLDAYLWEKGRFSFQDGVVRDDQFMVHTAVPLEDLHREGNKRIARMEQIRKVIASDDCRLRATGVRPAGLKPGSSAAVMLEMAAQGASVSEIVLRFHSVEYPVLSALYELVRQGCIEVVPEGEPVQPEEEPEIDVIEVEQPQQPVQEQRSVEQYLDQAQKKLSSRNYEAAVNILREGLQQHPYDPELCEALELAEKGFCESLRSTLLKPGVIPYLLKDDVMNLGSYWDPAQRYLLSRIDGNRSLRSIVMVSPLKEVDALKTIKQLIDNGIVGLRGV
ncbi:MAG: DUF4388 domain-containing protein [Deltaproteobacteria bacterium]|nr:MAG: DUF4388 domain-containing protein [Deltaproteobacteria bacterium]